MKVSDPREAAAEQPVPEAELTQQALTQMLYGYRRAEALHVDGILRAPDRAIELLEAFFPPAPHFFWFTDNF